MQASQTLESQLKSLSRDDLKIKNFWKEKHSDLWSFYCPLCTSARRIPYRPQPGGLRQVSQVAITAIFFTLVCWNYFSWKGLISVLPFWTLFEIIYRARVRAALNCPHCGFDAFLYLTDVQRARAEVENHWRKKFAEKGIPFPEKNPSAEKNLTQN